MTVTAGGTATGDGGKVRIFSVVIPTHNRALLLKRAVHGVLSQTFTALEVVVVDDGSTDETSSVVTGIGDERVRFLRQPRAGGTAARNAGARVAEGRYLAFLDDDDEVEPTWLAALAALVDDDPSCAIVSCGARYMDLENGTSKVVVPRDKWNRDGGQAVLFDSGAFAVRRDVFEEAGAYTPGLPSGPHHELALRLLPLCTRGGWSVRSCPEPLVRINERPDAQRARSLPANRYASALYKLQQHSEWFAEHSVRRARVLKVAGVSAAQMGRYGEARRYLLRAVRADPRRLGGYIRFLLACFPPIASRVWGAPRFAPKEGDVS